MEKNSAQQNYLYFFIVITIVSLIILGMIKTPTFGDEKNFHLPLIKNINWSMIFDLDSNYSSAYPPLPYLLLKFFYKIHPSVFTIRIINFIVFVFCSVFFYYVIKIKKEKWSFPLTLLFVLNPYLIRASYVFYMINYGLLFALISLWFYFKVKNRYNLILSHLFLLCAVLSMQWMLMVVVGIWLFEFDKYVRKKYRKQEFIKRTLYKVIFLWPVFFLFWHWKGLTHPNFHAHVLKATIPHLSASLAVVGFWFIIPVISNIKSLSWNILKWLIFILPVVFLGQPQHSSPQGFPRGPYTITGIVSTFCKKLEIMAHIPYTISTTFFTVSGIVLLIFLFKNIKDSDSISLYVSLGLIVSFTVSALLGASHIFILIPFILLALPLQLWKKTTLELVIMQAFLISVVYNVYVIFYASSGLYFIN